MKYENILPAVFLERPNRFIAYVEIDGKREICHVKNTGRCKELLVPGARVYVQRTDNPMRKTQYDLISVYKEERLVNIDSQAPNKVVYEWLKAGGLLSDITLIRPETTYGGSRFDFYVETRNSRNFIEVKGVTLERDGAVLFPDAPTERGVKHLRELAACRAAGFGAYVIFLIQMEGVSHFSPNTETHPAFAEALAGVQKQGVTVLAVESRVTPYSLNISTSIPVILNGNKGRNIGV